MIRLILILLILAPGCSSAQKLRGPSMDAIASRTTLPDGTVHEYAEMTADGGQNSDGLKTALTPTGITTEAEGSIQAMNFGPLVVFGWVSLLLGLGCLLCMMKFPAIGRLFPNSAPAMFIVQGVIFAFMTDFAYLMSSYILIGLVLAVNLTVIVPGWWDNLWRLRERHL